MYTQQLKAPTFVDLIRQQAETQPDRTAFTFLRDGENDEAALTVEALDERARAIGGWIQREGLAGERVFLFHPPGVEFLTAFFGCLYGGAVAVPAYPPRANRSFERLKAMAASARAAAVLTTSAVLAHEMKNCVGAESLRHLRWMAAETIPADLVDTWRPPALGASDLAVLQFTSGSTESPKGVMLSHGNLIHNSATIERGFEHTSDSCGVIWLPPFHDMGLIGGILQPLYAGFTGVLMSPVDFVRRPLRWLKAITRFKGTTSGGPNFAYDLCVRSVRPDQLKDLDLSSWTVAFTGAEPIHSATLDRFAETFAPCGFRREAFYPCYGLAEATLIVSGARKADPPIIVPVRSSALEQGRAEVAALADADSRAVVGCGKPLAPAEVVIVDPETALPCPPGRVGEIWVSGPSVAQGYWEHPEATETTFHARLGDGTGGRFLRTGDLGFLHDRELVVTGRRKELIIIRGRNHYPQDLERVAEESHTAIRPGHLAAFAVTDGQDDEERLVLVAELQRGQRDVATAEVVTAIRSAFNEQFGLDLEALVLIRTGSLPKTSSGKIQRTLCRSDYLGGTLEVVASWHASACRPSRPEENRRGPEDTGTAPAENTLLEGLLAGICARALGLETVGIHDSFFALGGGSIQILQVIEEAASFGISLTPEMLFRHQTVAELAVACRAEAVEPRLSPATAAA
jgi:acyl-CoA synthetase (AMP-forming)/AMP-acid ligase II